jgi:TusA-related sulfurtransferase
MRVVDTKGQQCPAPLIATRKALKESKSGESFKVLTASKNAFENISRFLKDNGMHFEIEENEGEWSIIITKSTAFDQDKKAEDYCSPI